MMKEPKFLWTISFLLVTALHLGSFGFLLASKKALNLEQNFGGFDYPIKDDNFESVMIVSDLPIGEFREVAINSIKASNPEPEISEEKSEISPLEDIKSEIEIEKKPQIIKEEKPKKKPKKRQKEAAPKIQKNSDDDSKNDSKSTFNSASKDSTATAPISGSGNKITSNSSGASKNQKSWKGAVISHLNKYKRYPNEALIQKQEGTVYIRVKISPSGEILGASIKKGTKFELLNDEALKLFRRASPLPKPPSEYFRDLGELTINFPIEFDIKKYKQNLK